MNESIRKLRTQIVNAITRACVDRGDSNGRFLQLLWGGDRVSGDVEHLEPQGLHFSAPADSSAVILAPGGSRAGALALGVGGEVPADALDAGEGGLHYLGAYFVFLAKDGTLALGAKAPTDFVALASKVDAELASIKTDLTGIKIAFDAHTHILALSVGTGTAAPPAGPAPPPHNPASVASAVVRAK